MMSGGGGDNPESMRKALLQRQAESQVSSEATGTEEQGGGEVVARPCVCMPCLAFKDHCDSSDAQCAYDVLKVNLNYPKMEYKQKSKDDPPISLYGLGRCFDMEDSVLKKVRVGDLVKVLTYLSVDQVEGAGHVTQQIILSFDFLYKADLDQALADEGLAKDFLRRVCMLFVDAWHAYFGGDKNAEWAAWQMRKFLSHAITCPKIAAQVLRIFFTSEFWPDEGPVQIITKMCKEMLFCNETLTLMCNLTRIEKVGHHLNNRTECISTIKEQFWWYCKNIMEDYEKSGGLLLHLLVNMSTIEDFTKFMIDANGSYFIKVVLVDLINKSDVPMEIQKAVWAFLRNLVLTDEGRVVIMDNLDIYLGPILLPIAGPEEIAADDCGNLPEEVLDLPKDKTRVGDKNVREYILDILYSLCRYRKDRVEIRNRDAYQIIKHYHLAETEESLIEKIEDLANILIRKEGSEIEVDDLLEGLALDPKQKEIE